MNTLNRIEEKHPSIAKRDGSAGFFCKRCAEDHPCSELKLARALARLAHQDECGCDDHSSPDCCATVVPGDCPTCEAERTLEEVAGDE